MYVYVYFQVLNLVKVMKSYANVLYQSATTKRSQGATGYRKENSENAFD